MPVEIELKVRVDSHDPVRERLRAEGAEFVATMLEVNRIYDRPDASLRKAACGLRVRSTTVLEGTGGGAKITFKGPPRPGPFKTRDEVEVRVDDADSADALLMSLGFVRTLEYEKRRERWRLGACVVELDEPARLGRFVEIEGPDERAIDGARTRLKLDGHEHITASYVEMAAKYCDDRGIRDFRLTMS